MTAKFGNFTEEKLEKTDFVDNQAAHKTLQTMIQKYDQM